MKTKEKDAAVKQRRKEKKQRRFIKKLLIFLSFIVIAFAAFLLTIRIAAPDFDYKTLIPKKIYTFYDEKLLGNTTTTTKPTTTGTTLTTASTQPIGHYLPQKEFKFDSDKKGSLVGNILNGGNAWHDAEYIYHIINGYGIYRMYPGTEEDVKLYSSHDKLSSLNVSSSKLYFVNNKNTKLYSMSKSGSTPNELASGVKTAYLYGETIYIVTTNNEIATMNTEKKKLRILRKVECKDINFIGISKKLMYFEVVFENSTSYVCIDKKGKTHAVDFRVSQNTGELLKPVMEDGFLYYYKKSGSSEYDLCRQKFGSEKVVTLIKNTSPSSYAEVENNRLFYCEISSGVYKMKELNMNSEAKKTLLSVSSVSSADKMSYCHGGTYDFIYGRKSENGSYVYASSCILTSSSRVMHFKDGKWKY